MGEQNKVKRRSERWVAAALALPGRFSQSKRTTLQRNHRRSAATLTKNLSRGVAREHLPTRRCRELVHLPSSHPELLLFYSLLSSSITRAAGGTRRMWRFHWIKNLRAIKSGPTPGIHQPRRAAAGRGGVGWGGGW